MSETNELIDISSTSKIIKKDGKWVIQKVILTKEFNTVLRKWQKKSEETVYLPISKWEPPLSKEVEFQIIFKRSAVDTYTLQPLSALFVQKIRAKANKDDENEFLNFFEGRVFLHDLSLRSTQPLGFRDSRVQRVGKPKRISMEQAKDLVKGNNVRVFSESPTGSLDVRLLS